MLYIEVIWQLLLTTPYINHNNEFYGSPLEVGSWNSSFKKHKKKLTSYELNTVKVNMDYRFVNRKYILCLLETKSLIGPDLVSH